MPQVSKRAVSRKTEQKIRRAFAKSLVGLGSERELENYIFDLLTPTERVMLAKRLAIAAFLIEGLSYQEIAGKLKVSTATIGRVNLWLQVAGNGYRSAVEKIGNISD